MSPFIGDIMNGDTKKTGRGHNVTSRGHNETSWGHNETSWGHHETGVGAQCYRGHNVTGNTVNGDTM